MTAGLAKMERMANMGRHLIRSCKYRLYPNGAQDAGLPDMLGHFCDLCNAGLQQRIETWRRQGVSLGYVDRVHGCDGCGLVLDRDVNPARNVLQLVQGPGTGLLPGSVRNAA